MEYNGTSEKDVINYLLYKNNWGCLTAFVFLLIDVPKEILVVTKKINFFFLVGFFFLKKKGK